MNMSRKLQWTHNYTDDIYIKSLRSEHKSAFYSLTPGSSPDTIESTMNLLDWTQDQIDGYQQSVYINGLQWSYCGNQVIYNDKVFMMNYY